jgi:hypothetical protein
VSKSVSVEPVLYDYLNGYVIVEDEWNVKFEIVELKYIEWLRNQGVKMKM